MSKSTKNFIEIRKIIGTVSPRILRLFYCSYNYDGPMNFQPAENFAEARSVDARF